MNSECSSSFSPLPPSLTLSGIHGYLQHQNPLWILPRTHYSQTQAATDAAAAAAIPTALSPCTSPNEAPVPAGASLPVSETRAVKPKSHKHSPRASSSNSEAGVPADSSISGREFHLNETGRKLYVCTLCDFSTKQKGLLKVHINSVHYNMKVFSCGLCKFVSIQKGNLQAHVRTVHAKERNFACEFCEYRAGTKGILKTHVKNRHAHHVAPGFRST